MTKPAKPKAQDPKGRNNSAKGNALDQAAPETQSPEGEGQSCFINLPDLPNNWRYAQVQDVGAMDEQAVMTGPFGTNLGRGDFISSGVPLLTISCLTDQGIRMDKALFVSEAKAKELGRYRLKQGDLLFSRMASVGRAGIVGPAQEGALFNYHIMRLRLDGAKMLPRFFTSYVRGAKQVHDYLLEVNHGATRDGINTEQLLSMPIILAPIEDQRRIVAEIEKQFTRLEAGVAALRRVQANLKRYRAAVLKAACEGRLVPTEAELARAEGRPFESGQQLLARILTERRQNWQGQRKYKEPASLSASGYEPDSLPKGWAWATPEQLSSSESYSLVIGPFGSNLKVSDYTTDGVPLIFVRNIRSGRFVKAKEVYVAAAKAEELKAHQAAGGDILITKMGAPPGDACLYPEDAPKAVITADCIKFRPSPLLPEKRFFVHALNSDIVKPQILDITKGVAQMKVSLGRFESIAIPLPPLSEQTRIVAEVERRLSVLEELEAVVTTNLQRATRLRQAVLQTAFTNNSHDVSVSIT